jgi:hypothetical protein
MRIDAKLRHDDPCGMDRTSLAAGSAALAVGVVIGFVAARGQLDAQWSRGRRPITQAQHARSSGGDANPTPAVGTKVLGEMPIGRMRKEMVALTANDPLLVTVGALGANEDGYELHLVVENHGTCEAVAYSGVAYGFDPWGRAAALNRGGEQYVAFHQPKEPGKTLPPHAKHTFSQPMHHADAATLVVAQIDEVTCADGSVWSRPGG